LQCAIPERLLAALERHCDVLGDSVFVTPFGERCRLVSGVDESVVLSVAGLQECDEFFNGFLGWHPRGRRATAGGIAGAASVSLCDAAMFSSNGGGTGCVEASRFERSADPRSAIATAERMSPAYTGVWMLTACAERVTAPEAAVVEVPFVGRRKAVVTRAPGGVRFGVFEMAAR
jgi:hypothetical protein